MTDIAFYTMPDGRRIAHRFTPGDGPTIVFLPGYMSDMAGSKATAIFDWAAGAGHACLIGGRVAPAIGGVARHSGRV